MRFFYVTIGIKIPLFRVSVPIEPGRSLLRFVTTNCLIAAIAAITMFITDSAVVEQSSSGENFENVVAKNIL